jgi:hypothetical protein
MKTLDELKARLLDCRKTARTVDAQLYSTMQRYAQAVGGRLVLRIEPTV